jgi:capsule polysaccharide export protein KpsE/RkpR
LKQCIQRLEQQIAQQQAQLSEAAQQQISNTIKALLVAQIETLQAQLAAEQRQLQASGGLSGLKFSGCAPQ